MLLITKGKTLVRFCSSLTCVTPSSVYPLKFNFKKNLASEILEYPDNNDAFIKLSLRLVLPTCTIENDSEVAVPANLEVLLDPAPNDVISKSCILNSVVTAVSATVIYLISLLGQPFEMMVSMLEVSLNIKSKASA